MSITFFFNRLSFYLLAIFALSLVIQLCIHWIRFSRLAFSKKHPLTKPDSDLEPVSVVVCARDAQHHLTELIPALYCSDDDTEEYLKDLERHETRVKPVQLRQHLNFFNGKKFPLSMGIKSASHDLIVLTDPDCRPTSNKWLRSMVGCYHEGTEMVIGYPAIENTGGLTNLLVRFNSVQRALMYLSAALAGRPYMGIGKNLSYRQRLFYRAKGFTSHYSMPEGDDDLFVSQMATRRNTTVHLDADNTVVCASPSTFGIWARQQIRRYSTINMHRSGPRFFAALHYWSQFLFYVSFIALLCLPPAFALVNDIPYAAYYYPTLAVLFLLRYITQIIIFLSGLILWDFLFALITPMLRISGKLNKNS